MMMLLVKTHANRTQLAARLAACLVVLILADGPAPAQSADPKSPSGSEPAAPPRRPAVEVWRPVGRIEHQPIAECSGIVASRRYPGIFWVHNDSGHLPVLYAVKESGELVAEVPVQDATNADWEDIAVDDTGQLYVGDIGNNYGLFPIRTVYQIAEPDPYASPVKPARAVKKYKYSYQGDRFDAEALCVRAGEILVIPRSRAAKTTVYRLVPDEGDKHHPSRTTEIPIGQITGGDISADGKRLAVCTPWALYVFSLDQEGRLIADQRPPVVRYPRCGVEACCFEGQDIILASEGRGIYRITPAQLAAGTRFAKPESQDHSWSPP